MIMSSTYKVGNIDGSVYIIDPNDPTKKIRFDLSNIGNNNLRILTIPDENIIIVGANNSQTLINKTIDATLNTITNLTKNDVGLSFVPNIKMNLNATNTPSTTNDQNEQYSIGSRWINVVQDREYVCVDNTLNNAIWIETTTSADSIQTATNVGVNGIGLFKQKTGSNLEFKNISAKSSKINVTNEASENTVAIDVNENNINIKNLLNAPSGDVVGTTDTQTLLNKTINSSSNNVAANMLRTSGGSVVIGNSLPPSVGNALIATSSNTAEWKPITTTGGGSISSNIVSGVSSISTTSTIYVLVDGITITPVSGTYIVTFSATGSVSKSNAINKFAIHVDNDVVLDSERIIGNSGNNANNLSMSLCTQTRVTVNGLQAINVKYTSDSGTFFMESRNMIIMKV